MNKNTQTLLALFMCIILLSVLSSIIGVGLVLSCSALSIFGYFIVRIVNDIVD